MSGGNGRGRGREGGLQPDNEEDVITRIVDGWFQDIHARMSVCVVFVGMIA